MGKTLRLLSRASILGDPNSFDRVIKTRGLGNGALRTDRAAVLATCTADEVRHRWCGHGTGEAACCERVHCEVVQ